MLHDMEPALNIEFVRGATQVLLKGRPQLEYTMLTVSRV